MQEKSICRGLKNFVLALTLNGVRSGFCVLIYWHPCLGPLPPVKVPLYRTCNQSENEALVSWIKLINVHGYCLHKFIQVSIKLEIFYLIS